MTIGAKNKENHFLRLPQELSVSIFDRVADLKCLYHCSLVSKHFAAAVSRVQTVSINVTNSSTFDNECLSLYWDRVFKLVFELKHFKAKKPHSLLDSLSFQHMKLPVFFDKLTELKFIYLNYDKSVNSHISTRKMKFYSNGAKIESFVALESVSMHKDTENVAGEEYDNYERFFPVLERITNSWWQFMLRYKEWICFVIVLMRCHGSMQKVTITDSEVHGKLVIGDEQGVKLEFDFLVELLNQFSDFIIRAGDVPVLDLPLSGYFMRGVALVIIYLPQNSFGRAKNLDEIVFSEFDYELPVFCEAVKEFLKNHMDSLFYTCAKQHKSS